ncbi:cupin domain-containing protein [Variovorax sp. J31P207]|uniref:cupin domain-containing protein n=1 Tax=Variovorax sp. J31P207 TaxID=3053510 RepID=UPI0025790579|nr:cupin domain-containing protein [Variovorax sp. J31P207]MDM0066286.1 cupin domain-containing protein [Variovorax sp. J31P207]
MNRVDLDDTDHAIQAPPVVGRTRPNTLASCHRAALDRATISTCSITPQENVMPLRKSAIVLALACTGGLLFHAPPTDAHEAGEETVSPKLTQALPNVPGKTFTSAIVDFSPGAKAKPHRHGDAFVYAYVLKGSVRSALNDEAPRVYRAGDNWSEPPGTRHPVTENASRTQPARLLVVFVANTGDALKTPDQP